MQKRFAVLLLVFLLCVFGGCAPQNLYMKAVANRETYINRNMVVAVIPENYFAYGEQYFFSQVLVTEMLDLGFNVVEKAHMEGILTEIKADGGIAREVNSLVYTQPLIKRSVKDLGKALGADAILLTYAIGGPSYIEEATIRMVDVETERVLFSITFVNDTRYPSSTISVANLISKNIKGMLNGEDKLLSQRTFNGEYEIRPLTSKDLKKSDTYQRKRIDVVK